MRKPVISPEVRSWLYPVVTAAIALIAAYGLIAEDVVPLWVSLASALLGVAGTGTAAVYRPSRVPHPYEFDDDGGHDETPDIYR